MISFTQFFNDYLIENDEKFGAVKNTYRDYILAQRKKGARLANDNYDKPINHKAKMSITMSDAMKYKPKKIDEIFGFFKNRIRSANDNPRKPTSTKPVPNNAMNKNNIDFKNQNYPNEYRSRLFRNRANDDIHPETLKHWATSVKDESPANRATFHRVAYSYAMSKQKMKQSKRNKKE